MAETDETSGQAAAPPGEWWQDWRDRRLPPQVLHLDTAAAGRSSAGTLRAVSAHADREATRGAYVAEGEAEPVLEAARADLAGLIGLPPGGLAFVASASAALDVLLAVWPLRPGDVAAVVPSEWGPNLAAFARAGLTVTELAAHGDGAVDLAALERFLSQTPPAFVHLTQVASHRPLVQPVAAAAALCRAAGVPLWVDAAQALGHVDTATGADVLYATSRKWLTGPRGAGLLAVAPRHWDTLRVQVSPLHRDALPGAPPVRLLEPAEAHVAGRIGLAAAVAEHLADGPDRVRARLAEVGVMTREIFGGLTDWRVLPAGGAPSAITALQPTAGQDVRTVRSRLLAEHRILTTAGLPGRAPREMTTPLLRVSPHVDCTPASLERLCDALYAVS